MPDILYSTNTKILGSALICIAESEVKYFYH